MSYFRTIETDDGSVVNTINYVTKTSKGVQLEIIDTWYDASPGFALRTLAEGVFRDQDRWYEILNNNKLKHPFDWYKYQSEVLATASVQITGSLGVSTNIRVYLGDTDLTGSVAYSGSASTLAETIASYLQGGDLVTAEVDPDNDDTIIVTGQPGTGDSLNDLTLRAEIVSTGLAWSLWGVDPNNEYGDRMMHGGVNEANADKVLLNRLNSKITTQLTSASIRKFG